MSAGRRPAARGRPAPPRRSACPRLLSATAIRPMVPSGSSRPVPTTTPSTSATAWSQAGSIASTSSSTGHVLPDHEDLVPQRVRLRQLRCSSPAAMTGRSRVGCWRLRSLRHQPGRLRRQRQDQQLGERRSRRSATWTARMSGLVHRSSSCDAGRLDDGAEHARAQLLVGLHLPAGAVGVALVVGLVDLVVLRRGDVGQVAATELEPGQRDVRVGPPQARSQLALDVVAGPVPPPGRRPSRAGRPGGRRRPRAAAPTWAGVR